MTIFIDDQKKIIDPPAGQQYIYRLPYTLVYIYIYGRGMLHFVVFTSPREDLIYKKKCLGLIFKKFQPFVETIVQLQVTHTGKLRKKI